MKSERIMISDTSDYYPCDLCDQMNLPHVSWHCTHDDPAHTTTVCHKCIEKLDRLDVIVKAREDEFEANRTDPFQKEF